VKYFHLECNKSIVESAVIIIMLMHAWLTKNSVT
jgi:hypothetical protein